MFTQLIVLLLIGGSYLQVPMAEYLPDGLAFREAAEIYYAPYGESEFGYVTRYGPEYLAYDELYRLAQEYRSQSTRGYTLLGGGYGYRWIDGQEYLIENRSSYGYALLADRLTLPYPDRARNQQFLYELSFRSLEDAHAFLDKRYVGIISTRSPNDLGREFCYYALEEGEMVGLVVVGGTAARNDWAYYGPSVNDHYDHLRLGQRLREVGSYRVTWIADVTDRLWEFGSLAALLPREFCELGIDS